MNPRTKRRHFKIFSSSVSRGLYAAIDNAAEQSARMQAMDNASKNAADMIERFTLAYNRLRQAKITTELFTTLVSGLHLVAFSRRRNREREDG